MTERAEFEAFWAKYPRKVARGDAWRAWQQTRDLRPTLAEILADETCLFIMAVFRRRAVDAVGLSYKEAAGALGSRPEA